MARATSVAFLTYEVPDLAKAEAFYLDFGLLQAGNDGQTLYMRAATTVPFVLVFRLAARPRVSGAAFEVATREELDALATLDGSGPVEALDGPGGGLRVEMHTPDDFSISAVWGRESARRVDARPPHDFNAGSRKQRIGRNLRIAPGPEAALRLGHFVLHVSDQAQTARWFADRFEMVPSDYLCVPGDPEKIIGSFLRLNCADKYVDHHSLLVVSSPNLGVHHCAYEVQDLDAVMASHDYLMERGYRLDVGVGRHLLGSQIFDYWIDPHGFRVEHYTDGDVVDDTHVPSRFVGTADQTTQWGARPSVDFFD